MVEQAPTKTPPSEAGLEANQDESNGGPSELASEVAQAAMRVQQRYAEEREKRLRDDGDAQYVDLSLSEKFKHYREDPWLNERSDKVTIQDGQHINYLILGAGWGGIQFAVKLIKAGITASDIRIVDSAGGFGGTWYYNRYPGLMCDVESYIYLPLLEEMDFIPKHKYSYGHEIRDYMNAIADKYDLSSTAMFCTKVNSLTWDESASTWKVNMIKERQSRPPIPLNITAHIILSASGLLIHPKLPAIKGIKNFQGTSFHTSRWAYDVTGGSQTDTTLSKLAGKRVGIIGTGATAIQVVPHLAKCANHLTIFQRTPSSVDIRNQRPTETSTWKTVASKPGWWRERNLNHARQLSNNIRPSEPNLVNDNFSNAHAYRALVGGPNPPYSMADIPAFVTSLHALDLPRAETVRARVESIVKDPQTAASLKAWYPVWCKRPTFHDDYLPVFNKPNVTLIDTDGKGVESLTTTSAIVNGQSYPLDILIFGTGFRAPGIGSPAFRAGMTITGRDGKSMDAKWGEGVSTLHGCMTHSFPNFFFPGPLQAGATANQNFTHDIISSHVAHVITEAQKRHPGERVVIEPTAEAEEMWSGEILKRSMAFAGMMGCTPSYLNGEGMMDKMPMEARVKGARQGIWGEGIEAYMNVLEAWQREGRLEGVDVKVV